MITAALVSCCVKCHDNVVPELATKVTSSTESRGLTSTSEHGIGKQDLSYCKEEASTSSLVLLELLRERLPASHGNRMRAWGLHRSVRVTVHVGAASIKRVCDVAWTTQMMSTPERQSANPSSSR